MVPLISFLNLLWHRPKNYKREESVESVETEEFISAKDTATKTVGISGGIESPIQFALQVTIGYVLCEIKYIFKADIPHQLQIYLMLNGYLPSPWSVSNYVEITVHDWFDNQITLPAISSLSLVFSFANMIRAANILNIYKTYGSTCEFR